METYVKNNKRGLGADKLKKKVVKTHHAGAAKVKNKQVLFIFLRQLGFVAHFSVPIIFLYEH